MGQTTGVASLCCIKTEKMANLVLGGIYPAYVETNTFNTARKLKEAESVGVTESVPVQNGWKGRPGGSADMRVTVKYQVPDAGTASTTRDAFDCGDETAYQTTYGYDDTTVDQFVGDGFSVALSDSRYDCEDPSMEILNGMRKVARSMVKGYNDKLNELLVASAGSAFVEAGGTAAPTLTTPLELPLFSTANKPQPMGLFPITEQYERMGLGGVNPYIIGSSSKISAYTYAASVFSRNDDGFDPNLGLNINAARDYGISAAAIAAGAVNTGDYAVSFVPDSVKPVDWYEFETDMTAQAQNGRTVWSPIQNSGDLVRQKIDLGSLFFGFPFVVDMQIRYDECVVGGAVHYTFKKNFDLWTIPQDAFNEARDQFHNYILLWDIVSRDVVETDL